MSYCNTVPQKTKHTYTADTSRRRPQQCPMQPGYQSSSSDGRARLQPSAFTANPRHRDWRIKESASASTSGATSTFKTPEPSGYQDWRGDEASLSNERKPGPEGNEMRYSYDKSNDFADQKQPQQGSSYHVVTPNPTKYNKLKATAQMEEERHAEYLARKREHVRECLSSQVPQRVGGQRLSEDEIIENRKRQEQDMRRSKIQKQIQKEEREREKRQREQEVYDRYKQQQREKAEKLEERKKLEDQQNLEELRRKRLARFDKNTK